MSCAIFPDTAARQGDFNAIAHADMRPFALAKPTIQLRADQIEKCRETTVTDDGADDAHDAQHGASRAHVWPAEGHPLTSRRTMRPDSPCKSEGLSRLSV